MMLRVEQLSPSFLRTHARLPCPTEMIATPHGVVGLLFGPRSDSPYLQEDAAVFIYDGIPYRIQFPDGLPSPVARVRQIRRVVSEIAAGDLVPKFAKCGPAPA